MDILSQEIMRELLDKHNANTEEREIIAGIVAEMDNPWDVTVLLALIRIRDHLEDIQ
jgi:hypothetical protein